MSKKVTVRKIGPVKGTGAVSFVVSKPLRDKGVTITTSTKSWESMGRFESKYSIALSRLAKR